MTEPRTEAAAIPCPFCGGELYDSVVKFQLDDGRWFEGSFCPHCGRNLLRRQEVAEAVAAYRAELRAKVDMDSTFAPDIFAKPFRSNDPVDQRSFYAGIGQGVAAAQSAVLALLDEANGE